MPAARAAAISGLSLCAAAVRMTQSAPMMLSALWPMWTVMPFAISSSSETEAFMSEPEIFIPMLRRTSPSGRIETPPMPTRCAHFPGRRYSPILLLADAVVIKKVLLSGDFYCRYGRKPL